MRKAVFFDIDGTLWNDNHYIPESTREAIRLLHEKGHLVFINSGRTRAFISHPSLFSLKFDGIISGCGTMIEYHNQRLFYKTVDQAVAVETMKAIRRYGLCPILEGAEYLYIDASDFAPDSFVREIMHEIGKNCLPVSDHWGEWEISKLACESHGADRDRCFAELSPWFDFMIHDDTLAELVPKGFNKGTGLLNACEMLHLDIKDTCVFGDSVNDLDMFKTAGIAVAMGNSSTDAKAAADYVTDDIFSDGIYNACRYLGLI